MSPGNRVWVAKLQSEGKVLTTPGSSGRVIVEVGNLKVELYPGDLELRAEEPHSESEGKPGVSFAGKDDLSTEVDLRGMTFEEAADVVDKYLDDLYLARAERATLIHGKGTGALRKKLGGFLRAHPLVKSQRLGHHNEGGSGVTVVELDPDR